MSDDNEIDSNKFADEQLVRQILDDKKALDQINDTSITRMPERVFVDVYLPFFAGDNPLPYDVGLNHWINLAGGPYKAVHVVDNSNVVLFTVPSVLNRDSVAPVVRRNGDGVPMIADVVANAQALGKQNPVEAKRYLDAHFSQRMGLMKSAKNADPIKQLWNDIFARYNRPSMFDDNHTPESSDGKKDDDSGSVEYEYEPL